jgi:phage terminase large subunit-like protein
VPAQAFIIGSLFRWKRLDGTRRFRRAYIEQGKGNGKSPLAGGIGLYGLMADGEAGAEIFSAGTTKEQAGILFRDAVKMVDKSPDLDKRLKRSGGPGRELISRTCRRPRSSGRCRARRRKRVPARVLISRWSTSSTSTRTAASSKSSSEGSSFGANRCC